jgi:hypothetical protein
MIFESTWIGNLTLCSSRVFSAIVKLEPFIMKQRDLLAIRCRVAEINLTAARLCRAVNTFIIFGDNVPSSSMG